jgi:hypothetical protein
MKRDAAIRFFCAGTTQEQMLVSFFRYSAIIYNCMCTVHGNYRRLGKEYELICSSCCHAIIAWLINFSEENGSTLYVVFVLPIEACWSALLV